LLVENL